jgi:predicted MFS family arabinose efflux permease
LGAFAVFFDLSLAIAGPLMGGLAASFGYASIYFAAALLALVGLGLTQLYKRRAGDE